jgi:hypothetical protein
MSKTTDPSALLGLATGLSTLVARLEPKEAAAVCGEATAILAQTMTRNTDPYAVRELATGLSTLVARLEPKEAGQAAATLALAMTKTRDTYTMRELANGLSAALTGVPLFGPRRHVVVAASAVGLATHSPVALSALPPLTPAVLSPPCPLTDQELVELLKQPLFVGEARRIVLDVLGGRHGRHFVDQWKFVQFAEDRRLGLDFTTPPSRPDPVVPLAVRKP